MTRRRRGRVRTRRRGKGSRRCLNGRTPSGPGNWKRSGWARRVSVHPEGRSDVSECVSATVAVNDFSDRGKGRQMAATRSSGAASVTPEGRSDVSECVSDPRSQQFPPESQKADGIVRARSLSRARRGSRRPRA
jgi:hypothetical protein